MQSNDALIFKLLRTEQPNPKQIEFFKATAPNICYGGARGGGKSWAMRRKFVLLAIKYPGIQILLLRRTMPELRKNHINPLKSELYGYAVYRSEERAFIFPNGSRIDLGYCDNDNDVLQYQGAEYDVIGFEEATMFEQEWIISISTSLRTSKLGFFKPRIYYTCNPGGASHGYIKRLFIDREYTDTENPDDYVFIPATVADNTVLAQADPDYVKRLEALPEAKKRAHLYGDWNVYEGQVFDEFRNLSIHYADRKFTHVIEPFEIPTYWQIYRSFDFGYAKPFSCGWWAVDYDGRIYRILELYGCTGEPNVGIKWSPDKIFSEIKKIETEHRWLKGKDIIGIADPSIWDASRGISVAEMAENCGVYFEPGDNKRLSGWMQMHYRLQFDENGYPMMYVFNNCRAFIRTLPLLQYDKNKPEDIDTSQEDHIADETRYMCMSRPITPAIGQKELYKPYDPLSSDKMYETRYDYYNLL